MSNNDSIVKLIDALGEAGIIGGETFEGKRQVIYHWLKRGRLILRRLPTSQHYIISDEEIQSIVKAFGPEGTGYWKPS